jgi:release factor glutamine methyltransferase
LQYILGSVGFYREEYEITCDCLIPRSDTEILVDEAVGRLKSKPGASFIDLCCGSGCIAISVLKNTAQTVATAVDISAGALRVAKKNASLNGIEDRIEFIEADVLKGNDIFKGRKFDAILSNPPYVTNEAYEELAPEIFHEPKIAFVGGDDGMDFYNRIVPLLNGILKKGGFAIFEIGYDQADKITKLAKQNSLKCEIKKDYSKIDRIAVMTFN